MHCDHFLWSSLRSEYFQRLSLGQADDSGVQLRKHVFSSGRRIVRHARVVARVLDVSWALQLLPFNMRLLGNLSEGGIRTGREDIPKVTLQGVLCDLVAVGGGLGAAEDFVSPDPRQGGAGGTGSQRLACMNQAAHQQET